MTACSSLLCCTCMVQGMAKGELCPGCGSEHDSPAIPAGTVVVKVVGSLMIYSATCKELVQLKQMKEHINSNVVPPSPSKLTLGQMIGCPSDAPPSDAERKLATSLVKRISNTSSCSSSPVLSLPTAGQVCLL